MFLRYDIKSTADQLDALKKTDAYLAAQPTTDEKAELVEMAEKPTEEAAS
jgi:hypothetical protein